MSFETLKRHLVWTAYLLAKLGWRHYVEAKKAQKGMANVKTAIIASAVVRLCLTTEYGQLPMLIHLFVRRKQFYYVCWLAISVGKDNLLQDSLPVFCNLDIYKIILFSQCRFVP